ncbi:MAG: hypothetical protein JO133_00265 [Burkholderiaceae bacterium]|nr:hypothetical protein [Burkholderiaceae bacterium]
MRKELRQSLFAAAIAGGVALAGCGGGGGGSSSGGPAPSPSPSPSPTPAPGPAPAPASAGQYFVTGHAGTGFGSGANTIAFFDSPQAVSPYPLVVVDPLAAPPAATQFESEITTLDITNLSEWFPVGGNATAWGVRYRVYARHNSASNPPVDNLYKIDLRKSGGASSPAPTQLTSAVIAGSSTQPPICWFDHQVFDNYRSADQSWIVFHAHGTTDNNCGTADDQFVAVEANMSASDTPLVLSATVSGVKSQLQPVEALYDSTGLITGFLAISHPPVDSNIVPTGPVSVSQLSTTMTVAKTFSQTLTGLGVTGGSGDFLSLGVSPASMWIYRDSSDIWVVNVAAGTSTKVYTVNAGDAVHGRAVFDPATPAMAYVSIDNNASPSSGGYVLQINTSASPPTATAQPYDAAATGGVTLVGVSSSNVVYLLTDRSAVKAVPKASLATAPTALFTGTATLTVDGPLGSPNGTPPVGYMVGDEVYFTVNDSSTANNNKQAYKANAGSTISAGAAITSGSGAVLGTIAAAFATSGPVLPSGALIVTTASFNSTTGLSFSAGTLSNYNNAGASASTLGTLPSTPMFPMTPLDVSTLPMQAGVPALLEMTGGNSQTLGEPVDDVGTFDPGGANTFTRVTTNMQ